MMMYGKYMYIFKTKFYGTYMVSHTRMSVDSAIYLTAGIFFFWLFMFLKKAQLYAYLHIKKEI